MKREMAKFVVARNLFLVDRVEEREWKDGHSLRMKQIGRLMNLTRQSRRVSLRELARRLSISAAYLSDMEKGNRMYSLMLQQAAMKAMRRAR